MAPSVVGSLNEKDEKSKKAKQPIVIWPEWTEQDIGQEKWVSQMCGKHLCLRLHKKLIINLVVVQYLTLFVSQNYNAWICRTIQLLQTLPKFSEDVPITLNIAKIKYSQVQFCCQNWNAKWYDAYLRFILLYVVSGHGTQGKRKRKGKKPKSGE